MSSLENEPTTESGMRVVEKDSVVNFNGEVPSGEHWIIEDAVNSHFIIPEGSEVTIIDSAVNCTHEGFGRYEVQGDEVNRPKK